MRSSLFLLVVVLCGLAACQKEPDASLLTTPFCKLDHIYYYDADTTIDTASYEYTGDLASKINYTGYYTELQYSGNRISKRNYYESGSTEMFSYEEFQYNQDSTLNKISFYLVISGIPIPVQIAEYAFTYSSGVLEKFDVKVDTSGTGLVPYLEYTYIATNGNLTSCYRNDLINQQKDTLHYLFDGNPNYFAKNPDLWLSDVIFVDFDGLPDGTMIPLAASVNNVISVGNNAGNINSVTYETNDKEDITSFSVDGQVWSRYFYKCQ